MSTANLAALTTDAIAGLGSAQIKALTTAQIVALTTDQVAALGTDQVAALSSAQVSALESGDIALFSTRRSCGHLDGCDRRNQLRRLHDADERPAGCNLLGSGCCPQGQRQLGHRRLQRQHRILIDTRTIQPCRISHHEKGGALHRPFCVISRTNCTASASDKLIVAEEQRACEQSDVRPGTAGASRVMWGSE